MIQNVRGVRKAPFLQSRPRHRLWVKHTDCKSMDFDVVLRGAGLHDNICSTCENLQNDGKVSNWSSIPSYI